MWPTSQQKCTTLRLCIATCQRLVAFVVQNHERAMANAVMQIRRLQKLLLTSIRLNHNLPV